MSVQPVPSDHRPVEAGELTQRYVREVTLRLPEELRADVADELRGSIGDRVEALLATRRDLDEPAAERLALVELGEPDRLAAGYTGSRLHLVGPELYPTYVRTLRGIAVVAVPAAAFVAGVVSGYDERSVAAGIGSAVWTAFHVALQVFFWVTLAYAVVERGAGGDSARSALSPRWSPDHLPALPRDRGSLSDAVASVVWLGLLAGLLTWQQVRPPLRDGDEALPVLDPELWSFWLPLILVLIVAEMIFEVVRHRTASPRPALNVLLGAVFTAPWVYLGMSGQLLNPAAVDRIQQDWAGFDPGATEAMVAVVAVLIWAWDAVEGWLRARRQPAAG